jgi:hypothetical protein
MGLSTTDSNLKYLLLAASSCQKDAVVNAANQSEDPARLKACTIRVTLIAAAYATLLLLAHQGVALIHHCTLCQQMQLTLYWHT